jgi:hypothetical protein
MLRVDRGILVRFKVNRDGVNTYWITTGQKGVRCSLNADGDRLGRVDFGSKNGIVESAHVVHKHSERGVDTHRQS